MGHYLFDELWNSGDRKMPAGVVQEQPAQEGEEGEKQEEPVQIVEEEEKKASEIVEEV